MILRTEDWSVAAGGMRRSGKRHAFTGEDFEKYKEAWSKPGAMTAIFNWYRPQITNDMRVRVQTLMLWGVKDVALTYRMVRPSSDYCDDGI